MKKLYLALISISLVTSSTFFAIVGDIVRNVGDTAADVTHGTAHFAGDTVDRVTGHPAGYRVDPHPYNRKSVVGKEAGYDRTRHGYY